MAQVSLSMDVEIPEAFDDVLRVPDVGVQTFGDDGRFPNNHELPVVLLKGAFRSGVQDLARRMEQVFRAHNWRGSWRNGIFSYHHYHSTTHEVLGVSRGTAHVQLGGPEGASVTVEQGDVMVLPVGVAHKNLGGSRFQVVGAYPEGRQWDLKTGEPSDRPEADRNIAGVPRPSHDPVYGQSGPVIQHWTDV